jgi:hypothetical protein
MGWRRKQINRKNDQLKRGSPRGPGGERVGRASENSRVDRHVADSGILLDSRLGHPANADRRAQALRAGQQALGNRGVRQLIQAKPEIRRPGDPSGPTPGWIPEGVTHAPQRQVQRQLAPAGAILRDEDTQQTRPLRLDEFVKDYIDYNIDSADYWLAPSSFIAKDPRLARFWINYQDGRRLAFSLNKVPARAQVRQGPGGISVRSAVRERVFIKRGGFIYPRGFNDATTPRLIDVATAIRINHQRRQKRMEITQLGFTFAIILASYPAPGEGGAAALGGRAGRFGRLPRRVRGAGPSPVPKTPLPPIPRGLMALQRSLVRLFRRLGGRRTKFEIRVCEDATVIETKEGMTKVGLLAEESGGAFTDPVSKVIWVHEKTVRSGGLDRAWGRLNLRQVVAHEIGHAQGATSKCSIASAIGAKLSGLKRAEKIGLLDDAVQIARKEGVALKDLNLPRRYKPPPPI